MRKQWGLWITPLDMEARVISVWGSVKLRRFYFKRYADKAAEELTNSSTLTYEVINVNGPRKH